MARMLHSIISNKEEEIRSLERQIKSVVDEIETRAGEVRRNHGVTSGYSGEHGVAIALEMEGLARENTFGLDEGAKQSYRKALKILDKNRFYGECIRLAQRIGDAELANQYANKLRKSWGKEPKPLEEAVA